MDRADAKAEASRRANLDIEAKAGVFLADAGTVETDAHNAYHAAVGATIDPTPHKIAGRE